MMSARFKITLSAIFLFAIFSCSVVSAQRTQTVREKLTVPDTLHRTTVTVTEQGEAASIVRMLESQRPSQTINGYRVTIFLDNSQTARANALSQKAKFEEIFPDTPVYFSYNNPYFKVSVGNCVTKDEAIILWGRVKNVFDKAFVANETFDISELVK